MNTNHGFVIWARQTIESDIFLHKPDKWFKIFFFLVCSANYEDFKGQKRGEIRASYSTISTFTGATKNEIYKCIKWLKEDDMIIQSKTTKGYVRFLPNYAKYQDFETYKDYSKDDKRDDKRDDKGNEKKN